MGGENSIESRLIIFNILYWCHSPPWWLRQLSSEHEEFCRIYFEKCTVRWKVWTSPGRTQAKNIRRAHQCKPSASVHIGHLRNVVLGDSLVRLLRASGHQ